MHDNLIQILVGLPAVFLAGMVQGLTAFGFALISVPILILVISPKIVVPLVIIYASLICMAILFQSRHLIDLRRIWFLIISGVAGIPLGTYLLATLDAGLLKILIGAVIVPFAIALFMGFQKAIKNEKLASIPVGFVSGLLQGSTSLSGPPIILFFVNQGMEKQNFRANLVTYFTVLNISAIVSFILGGIMTAEVFRYALWFSPAMIVGAATGIKLTHRVNDKLFRNIALLVVTIAGLLSIASGLGIL